MAQERVLLLENVAAQAAGVREALTASGYEAVISRYEADGLDKFARWNPVVVVVSTSYPKGSMADFCAQLARDAKVPFRLIVTSTLSKEKLAQVEPELEKYADGYLKRPFTPGQLLDVVGKAAAGGGPKEPPAAPLPAAKTVLLLDTDAEVDRVLRQALEPKGVKLAAVAGADALEVSRSARLSAIVLSWPLPPGFTLEMLREIQQQGEDRLPVLLLSGVSREVLSEKSPALFQAVSMLFPKPVPWKQFFPFLQRLLAMPRPEGGVKPKLGEASKEVILRAQFQGEMEKKYLEIVELKRRLAEAEGRGVADAPEEISRLRKEVEALRRETEEARRGAELVEGRARLRETDLEVKLSKMIRMKDEAQRDAQDLIESTQSRLEDSHRELMEVQGEVQMRKEEGDSLRQDLEKALVEKEQFEERAQAAEEKLSRDGSAAESESVKLREELLRLEGERRSAAEQLAAAREKAAGEKRLGEEVRQREEVERKERERLENALREREERLAALEGDFAAWKERSTEAEEVIGQFSAREKAWKQERMTAEEELGTLRERADEGERRAAALEEKLALEKERREKEAASVVGLEGQLRERVTLSQELEEKVADLLAREEERGELEEKVRSLESRLGEREGRIADLESQVEGGGELEEKVRSLESRLGEREGRIADLESQVEGGGELEEKVRSLESRLGEREGRIADLESQVEGGGELEEKVRSLESRLGEREGRIADLESQVEGGGELEEKVRSLESRLGEREGRIADLESQVEGGGELEEKVRSLESRLGEREGRIADLEEQLARSGESAAGSDESAARVRELEDVHREREVRLAEVERILAESESQVRALAGKAGEREEKIREESGLRESLQAECLAAEERLRQAERELAGERGARKAMEEEYELQLLQERERRSDLDARLLESVSREKEATAGREEYGRMRELLEEVMEKARDEVVERTRRETELEGRLRSLGEEKRFVVERLEREAREAGEREKRLTALLESALLGTRGSAGEDNLPAPFAVPAGSTASRTRWLPVVALFAAAAAAVALFAWRGMPPPRGGTPLETPPVEAPAPAVKTPPRRPDASPQEIWEAWTRRDFSGGVLIQATMRSREQIESEVEAEGRLKEWSSERIAEQKEQLLEPYRFGKYLYFHVYLKNVNPGYPPYFDDVFSRLMLRDSAGGEAKAFLPEGLEHIHSLHTFREVSGSGEELEYFELNIPVAFARSALSAKTDFLQLLAFDIGSTSRRVLTWEVR